MLQAGSNAVMPPMEYEQDIADLGWYFASLSFILGAIVGSFLNVCIYRVPAKRSIVKPGSHCYQCGSHVAWYDNVPIVSYLVLKGHCRHCGAGFSSRYMWIELLTAILFLVFYLKFGLIWALPFHLIVVSLLIFGTFTDIDHYIIADSVTLGGLIFALGAAALLGFRGVVGQEWLLAQELYLQADPFLSPARALPPHWQAFGWSVASAGLGWGLLWSVALLGRLLFRKEAMGGGDIKLFAFLGAYLGALNCLWVLFLSAMVGSVLGISLLIAHRLVGREETEIIELRPEPPTGNSPSDDTEITTASAEQTEFFPQQTQAVPSALTLKVVRNTAQQLHHFPYGPYIALAALVVLFFHQEINRHTREYLLLPLQPEAVSQISHIVPPLSSTPTILRGE